MRRAADLTFFEVVGMLLLAGLIIGIGFPLAIRASSDETCLHIGVGYVVGFVLGRFWGRATDPR